MPRYVLPVLILGAVMLALLLTWITLGRGTGMGGAETTVTEQDVAPFRRLEVNGAAEVTLRPGATEHVSVETSPSGSRVVADVEGSTLTIVARDNRRWWAPLVGGGRRRVARITVTYRTLDAIALSGAINLTAASLETPELRLVASGGSSMRLEGIKTRLLRVNGSGALKAELAGVATEQKVSISGAGEYNAERLASTDASVSVSGVGRVVVRVEKTLAASISGAGTIDYFGSPDVKEQVSGVGRVRRREAAAPPAPRWHVASWLLGGAVETCFVL